MYKYEKLVIQLTEQIEAGHFIEDGRFPSIRETAGRYGLGINTVKTAYDVMEDQGLIEAKSQSGYFVKTRQNFKSASVYSASLRKLPISGVEKILTDIVRLKSEPDYVDLALACPNGERYFPTAKIKNITLKLLKSRTDYLMDYVLPPGSRLLREQIAQRSVNFGVSISPDDIILTHGTMDALAVAIQVVSQVGDKIAVETPTFYNLYPLLKRLGRYLYEVPTSAQTGLCLESLETQMASGQISAVITIPTGHNPLGFSMPLNARKKLAALAALYQVPVIENTIYADLQYGERLPHVKSFDQDGWVLTCSSFTKTIAPDYRIGWLNAGRYTELAQHIKLSSSVTESLLLSDVIGTFVKSNGYEKHLESLRQHYFFNLNKVRHLMLQCFPVGTAITMPSAGFILWVELPLAIDALKLYQQALTFRILIMPGVLCSLDQQHQNCLRVPVCRDINEAFEQAIRTLGTIACSMLKDNNG